MPPKADALQARIDYLSHELEMYTFVNKGVLQSNNEYKLRIAELERENAVLSTAERNLTATEDALEACERALKDLEKERDALAFRLKREEIARKGAERERDIWKGWFEDLEGAWGVADKAMKGALARKGQESKEEERAKVSRNAGPSRTRPSRPDGARATSRPRATQADTSMESENELSAPTQPSVGPSSARKRRRQEASTPEAAEEDDGPRLSMSPTPPPKRRIEASRKSVTSSATKKRPNVNTPSHKPQEESIKPKTEPLSPSPVPRRPPKKRTGRYYSDDDPLAIGHQD